MFEFPEAIRIPARDVVDSIMSWLLQNLSPLFDAIGWVILQVMEMFELVFTNIPWFLMVPIVFFLGFKMLKKWQGRSYVEYHALSYWNIRLL
jgi:ABC-type proline/glycine betaine transport system permease subunit